MSWQAMNAVDQLPADATKPLAYRVLVKLANVAAQDGTRAWRFVLEMADELERDERSIRRALRELEDLGYIVRGDQRHVSAWQGNRRPTVYNLDMDLCLGGTRLSTATSGGTFEGTTGVQQRELRELLNSSTQDNQTEHVPSAAHVTGQCPSRGIRGHDFDAVSRYCLSCGLREDQAS